MRAREFISQRGAAGRKPTSTGKEKATVRSNSPQQVGRTMGKQAGMFVKRARPASARMTTRLEMAEMVATQARVIAVLRDSGDERLAERLALCMKVSVGRCSDGGRPWTFRSAGCS